MPHVTAPERPVSLQDTLRARWIVFRQGPAGAWQRAINRNDMRLGKALWHLGAPSKEVRSHALMRAVGGRGLPAVDAQILELVLRSGANPNAQESNNYWDRLLHRAVVQGRLDKARILLENGADPDSRDGNKYTPLASALVGFGKDPVPFARRQPLVSLLLKSGADPGQWGRHGRDSMLSMVPMDDADLCLKTFDELLSHGADPMKAGVTLSPDDTHGVDNEPALLFRATQIHDLEFLDRFLCFMEAHGQGASTRGSKGQTLVHEMIKAWGPIPGGDGDQTSLFYEKVLELLEEKGYDLKARDNDGNTLWHSWAKGTSPFPWTADALLSYPTSREMLWEKNNDGQTPLGILQNHGAWEGFNQVSQRVIARLTEAQMTEALPNPSSSSSEKAFPPRTRL